MERDPAASAIEAFRQATTCAPSLRAANLAAVKARVAGRPDVVAPARARVPGWVIAVVAVAAAAAAVWWGATWWSSASVVADRELPDQAIDAPRVAVSDGRAVPTGEARPIAEAPSPRPIVPPVIEPSPPLAIAPRAAVVPTDQLPTPAPIEVAPTDDPLSREAGLIAATRTALGKRALDDAAAAIDRHAREFPDGAMVPERLALAVRLECVRGDLPAARTAAAAYVRARPESAIARRLLESPCGADEIP